MHKFPQAQWPLQKRQVNQLVSPYKLFNWFRNVKRYIIIARVVLWNTWIIHSPYDNLLWECSGNGSPLPKDSWMKDSRSIRPLYLSQHAGLTLTARTHTPIPQPIIKASPHFPGIMCYLNRSNRLIISYNYFHDLLIVCIYYVTLNNWCTMQP